MTQTSLRRTAIARAASLYAGGLLRQAGAGGGATLVAASYLNFDGANASTTFTDGGTLVPGVTWTANGGAVLSTTSPKFGSACGLFDGSTARIVSSNSTAFGFGLEDWCIRGWVRSQLNSGTLVIFDNRVDGVGIAITLINGYINVSNNVSNILTSLVLMTLNTYKHVALVRQGTTLRLYVDGVQQATATDARTYASTTRAVYGGLIGGTNLFTGRLDDFQIVKGDPVYPDGNTYTPPTAALG